MKLKVAQVIGLNTDQKAAQVISVAREDNAFLAVLDLTSDDAFTKGRQVLSDLADFYFDAEGTTPAEKLKATFDQAKNRLEGAFAILLSAVSGKVLYLISQGDVEAHLKRADKFSSLLSVGASNQLISGFLQEGDKLFLSTSSLISFLGTDLSKILELPIESFEQDLTDRIGAADLENQGLAALEVEVEQEEFPILDTQEPSLDHRPSLLSKVKTIFFHLSNYLPKGGRGKLIIAVVLIVIIALGIGFKVKLTQQQQKEAAFKQVLQQAKDDFNAAKGLATLNPQDAKGKLDSAKDKINQAVGLKPKDGEAQNLKKQIEEESASILQQSQISEFPLFLDLDLVKKNFRANQLSLSNGKLLLLDPQVKTLISIDFALQNSPTVYLAKKSPQILAGSEQLGEGSYASLNGDLAFVYSQDKGILKIDITNKKAANVIKKDQEWGEIKDIYGFAGNVYLLDKNQIWKYLPTKDGYSDKREYLTKKPEADFTNSLRMQIESSIYILKKDGEMLRFTRGDKDNFSYGGLDKGVKDPNSFFVSSDTDNLYLLDSGNSRMLILTKTGSYKGQINGEKFAQASDLVVDEKGKKVYLLEGSKIYQIDLK